MSMHKRRIFLMGYMGEITFFILQIVAKTYATKVYIRICRTISLPRCRRKSQKFRLERY